MPGAGGHGGADSVGAQSRAASAGGRSGAASPASPDDDRRALVAAAAALAARLAEPAATGAATLQHEPPRLRRLAGRLGLSPFERHVLLLCAGVEIDPALQAACRQRAGGAALPSFALALAALAEPHWSALAPDAPLRRWRLVEVAEGGELLQARLAIDERLLHHLMGLDPLDERLQPHLRPVAAPVWLPPSRRAQAGRLAPLLADAHTAPCVQIGGHDVEDGLALAAASAAAAGLQLLRLQLADLPEPVAERRSLARLWSREALLAPRALAVVAPDAEGPRAAMLAALADDLGGPLFLLADGPVPALGARERLQVELAPLPAAEQRWMWQRAATAWPAATGLDATYDQLSQQFRLGAAQVQRAGQQARQLAAGGLPPAQALWQAARGAARPRLGALVHTLTPQVDWNDLVLPPREAAALRAIGAHLRQRHRVYQEWGFADRHSRGLGLTALFSGPSGTGKTLAAEVLAHEQGLDLVRIDLSAVVSKYIGETEKNLRSVFDAAEQGGAVLLFDEADALFGKRSEVRDSHDRYANIEVGYLLQRMEAYRGLAILTTNLRSALDASFLRRIRFVVEFPFPAAAERARIWRRSLPPRMPLGRVDCDRLARLNVAGGHIRSIALNAAVLAADAGEPLGMQHLLAATRTEYAKLERPLNAVETEGWL
ncbi:ATP-binding protein [Aquincola sp. J276]|uniref:ATP-binding protein n=1 Tax=Aquincola sp. J276 TaxID=2898432 RepID=UPI00385750C1